MTYFRKQGGGLWSLGRRKTPRVFKMEPGTSWGWTLQTAPSKGKEQAWDHSLWRRELGLRLQDFCHFNRNIFSSRVEERLHSPPMAILWEIWHLAYVNHAQLPCHTDVQNSEGWVSGKEGSVSSAAQVTTEAQWQTESGGERWQEWASHSPHV
jgi:hypothetical protein